MSRTNTITVKVNGPLICEGDITVLSAEDEILLKDKVAWLCRCGASKNMPFCDGQHKQIKFSDPAIINDQRGEKMETAFEPLTITVKEGAMLIVKGPVRIQNQDGSSFSYRSRAALCRCGASENKPFCDLSHKHHPFDNQE